MGNMRNVFKFLVGRPKHRWGDNIGMDFGKMGRGRTYGLDSSGSV
jgi:hypothetical protein